MTLREHLKILGVVGSCLYLAAPAEADQDDRRLVALFAELGATQNAERAQAVEARIWSIWLEPPAAAGVADAMQRGLRMMSLGQGPDALRAFDAAVAVAPDYAEAWNKRATVRYALGDLSGSIEDIQRTLILEPRHFGALSGLGLVRLAQDRPAEALAAFEAALTIHPHLPGLANIEALRDRVRGKPL